MKTLPETLPNPRPRLQARTSVALLLAGVAVLGLAITGFWFFRAAPGTATDAASQSGAEPISKLSESTKAVLRELRNPIEIRFYTLKNQPGVSASLNGFCGRVDELLADYQRSAGGKITIVQRATEQGSDAMQAAAADGLEVIALENGEVSFLGLAVLSNGQKIAVPRLDPAWEPALESDVSRAIVRASKATPAGGPAVPAPIDPAIVEGVKRTFPNLSAISVEEGSRVLRDAALAEFKTTLEQSQGRLSAAEERVAKAQNGGSADELQAAKQALKQVQAEQTEKMQAIALRLQDQTEALKRLKAN